MRSVCEEFMTDGRRASGSSGEVEQRKESSDEVVSEGRVAVELEVVEDSWSCVECGENVEKRKVAEREEVKEKNARVNKKLDARRY